jgi:hypothetical protein
MQRTLLQPCKRLAGTTLLFFVVKTRASVGAYISCCLWREWQVIATLVVNREAGLALVRSVLCLAMLL